MAGETPTGPRPVDGGAASPQFGYVEGVATQSPQPLGGGGGGGPTRPTVGQAWPRGSGG